jgi:hypothetical protein
MGLQTQNGGPHLLVLYWKAGETHMVKDNGSGWVRWLKLGGVIQANPKHRDSRYALELPFDYFPPIQGSLHLVNFSKRKAEASCSSVSSCSCNLATKKRWEGASCSSFPAFTSLFQCLSLALYLLKWYNFLVSSSIYPASL